MQSLEIIENPVRQGIKHMQSDAESLTQQCWDNTLVDFDYVCGMEPCVIRESALIPYRFCPRVVGPWAPGTAPVSHYLYRQFASTQIAPNYREGLYSIHAEAKQLQAQQVQHWPVSSSMSHTPSDWHISEPGQSVPIPWNSDGSVMDWTSCAKPWTKDYPHYDINDASTGRPHIPRDLFDRGDIFKQSFISAPASRAASESPSNVGHGYENIAQPYSARTQPICGPAPVHTSTGTFSDALEIASTIRSPSREVPPISASESFLEYCQASAIRPTKDGRSSRELANECVGSQPEVIERVGAHSCLRRVRSVSENPVDTLLLCGRANGLTYRTIKIAGNFAEAESTLRGRYRTLTKARHRRVRTPKWTATDVVLLRQAVAKFASLSKQTGSSSKKPWKKIAEYIASHGGTYHFGYATCCKKWREISNT